MKKKILILRFSSIGDIVLTTPVIRCVKEQVPNAEVHFATKKSFAAIVKNNPYLDKIHYLDKNQMELLRTLKAENFDYIIDLHHNQRTFLFKQYLQKPSTSFDKLNFKKWLYVNLKWDTLPQEHIVDRYLKTAAPLGVQNDGDRLDYFIAPEEKIVLRTISPVISEGFIALVLGAKFATKSLSSEKLTQLCNSLNTFPVVLLGGKEDVEKAAYIMQHTTHKNIFNTCGQFSLNQSASIVSQSNVVITHDTGLMHIAAAFNKPIVSLWGNTTPRLGMYPYNVTHQKIIENNELACRPCSKIGYATCPLKHHKCVEDLKIEEIVKAAVDFYNLSF